MGRFIAAWYAGDVSHHASAPCSQSAPWKLVYCIIIRDLKRVFLPSANNFSHHTSGPCPQSLTWELVYSFIIAHRRSVSLPAVGNHSIRQANMR